MKYYRPSQELTGKRLSASTLASFMAAQFVDEPDQICSGVDMSATLLRFLLRNSALSYWSSSKNRWLKADPFNRHFTLTNDGIKKVQDRLAGRAKAQSVTRGEVLTEFQIIRGVLQSEEPLVAFELPTQSDVPEDLNPGDESNPTWVEFEQDISIESTSLWPDDLPQGQTYFEGLAQQVTVNRYERSAEARAACIAHYGCVCQVCKLDFSKRYGVLGAGFIHVHHVRPVSSVGSTYRVDPVADLVPVCPNCHAMLHRFAPPLTIERLRALLHEATCR
ncbi:HNH endonuclease [Cupriavidus necator]